jgi:hypothetical protein
MATQGIAKATEFGNRGRQSGFSSPQQANGSKSQNKAAKTKRVVD